MSASDAALSLTVVAALLSGAFYLGLQSAANRINDLERRLQILEEAARREARA